MSPWLRNCPREQRRAGTAPRLARSTPRRPLVTPTPRSVCRAGVHPPHNPLASGAICAPLSLSLSLPWWPQLPPCARGVPACSVPFPALVAPGHSPLLWLLDAQVEAALPPQPGQMSLGCHWSVTAVSLGVSLGCHWGVTGVSLECHWGGVTGVSLGCHWSGARAPCCAPGPGSFGMWRDSWVGVRGIGIPSEVVTAGVPVPEHGSDPVSQGSLHWGHPRVPHHGLCLGVPAGAAVPGPRAGAAPALSGSNFSSHMSTGCGWDGLCRV